MSNYTEAPWKVKDYNPYIVVKNDDEIYIRICDTANKWTGYDEGIANAQLIAASPEIYNNAKKLIDVAVESGADAVKFQKREPEVAVPEEEWHKKRKTPWGTLDYIDYKRKIEFGYEEYKEIDEHCKEKDIIWTASV